MKSPDQTNIVIAGILLAVTALVGTGLMAAVNTHSRPYIEANEHEVLLKTINAVLPAEYYDNQITKDTIHFEAPGFLGTKESSLIYRGWQGKTPSAVVMTVIAPNGYTGPIKLLVGVNYDGQITGVRVVKHRETPGLGDAIERKRSDWITGFDGKSLDNPSSSGWHVQRDGGEFDQFTGATITPRAVVGAVHNALKFYRQHRAEIFKQTKTGEESLQQNKKG